MLRIIKNSSEIKGCYKAFIENFDNFIDEKVLVKIGYQGGNVEKKISWSKKLGLWFISELTEAKDKYWNAFGIAKEKPKKNSNVPIVCEINLITDGIDRNIGGIFAKDVSGSVILLHRGKIGGGKKGIGKKLFEENYRGERITFLDGDVENSVALVGSLKSNMFPYQIRGFVYEVKRIKELARFIKYPVKTDAIKKEFNEEFKGKKRYKIQPDVEANCNHGLIVNELATNLQTLGFNVANDKYRDLFILNEENQISVIFEIKTDNSKTSLYSGIGQLLLNSLNYKNIPRLILTIPEKLDKITQLNLREKLNIESLKFNWNGKKFIFPTLGTLDFGGG